MAKGTDRILSYLTRRGRELGRERDEAEVGGGGRGRERSLRTDWLSAELSKEEWPARRQQPQEGT